MALNAVELSLYLSQAALGECVACAAVHRLGEWHSNDLELVRRFEPCYLAARLAGDEPKEYAPALWPNRLRPVNGWPKGEAARIRLFHRRYGRADR